MEIREHPLNERAWAVFRREVLESGERIALAPQVLLEFIHVATDPKRFARPLSMSDAIDRAAYWWSAVETTHIYPNAETMTTTLEWLGQFGLGRKRLLDTHLAATLWTIGVRRVLTLNAGDFASLPDIQAVTA